MLEVSSNKTGGSDDFAEKFAKRVTDRKEREQDGGSMTSDQKSALNEIINMFPYIKDKVISL